MVIVKFEFSKQFFLTYQQCLLLELYLFKNQNNIYKGKLFCGKNYLLFLISIATVLLKNLSSGRL